MMPKFYDPDIELHDDHLRVLVEVTRVYLRGGSSGLCERFADLAESDAQRLGEWVEWIKTHVGCRCRTLDFAEHLVRGVYLLYRCGGTPD